MNTDRYIVRHGDENGFSVTVEQEFSGTGFQVTVWRRNHGMGGFPVIRQESKARSVAGYLYETLLDEYEAEQARQKEEYKKFKAEVAARPKPKPIKIPKNAPKVDVLECPECDALIPSDEVSGERVYECGECGTKGAGSDARQCEQCHKFCAKISDTSCPECDGPMDGAETVQAQKATNDEWVKVEAESKV
jgi:hypothetical protein